MFLYLDFIDDRFVRGLRRASFNQGDSVHLREIIPVDAFELLKTESRVVLIEVKNNGRSIGDTIDLFQQIRIFGAEVRRRRSQLDRSWTGKDNFGANVRRAALQFI